MSAKKSQTCKPVTRSQVLAALHSQLKLHAALGIDFYPVSDDLQRFFELTERRHGALPAALLSFPGKNETASAPGVQGDQVLQKLQLLEGEIAECRLCPLSSGKLGSIFGQGGHAVTLMVVGDWSLQEQEDAFSRKLLFGPDEDVMLWNMMAAIGLKPEDIYVTDCLKCCPGQGTIPDDICRKSCFSYLEREIALVKPRIVCAMGEVAARMLTGSSEPLSRLRGRFSSYRYGAGHEIDIMPTYHPRFLLRHQEMKKAAWLDLQAIAKRLAAVR